MPDTYFCSAITVPLPINYNTHPSIPLGHSTWPSFFSSLFFFSCLILSDGAPHPLIPIIFFFLFLFTDCSSSKRYVSHCELSSLTFFLYSIFLNLHFSGHKLFCSWRYPPHSTYLYKLNSSLRSHSHLLTPYSSWLCQLQNTILLSTAPSPDPYTILPNFPIFCHLTSKSDVIISTSIPHLILEVSRSY